MRNIQDILYFRSDISPFLIHLTRGIEPTSASDIFKKIICEKQLVPGCETISDAMFGVVTTGMTADQKMKYFGAVCFTETPINEIHSLLDISGRSVN